MNSWDGGALVALGAFHGINPAMGWLFAAAIGFREQTRRALFAALGPIAAGHAASMALTILLVEELRVVASDATIRIAAALALLAFAATRVARDHRHPRWVGMHLQNGELAVWSFLMSTAHGAGLMLIPILIGTRVEGHDHMLMVGSLAIVAAAVAVHSAAMIAVSGAAAFVVYEFVGVGVLRRGWLNLDRLWVYALAGGAAVIMFVG